MTTKSDDTTNHTDLPLVNSEAHQPADWGKPIYIYTRRQALEDGALVDVSELANEAGFSIPVALTRSAWEDCVEWDEEDSKRQVYQDQIARLWDVLWLAALAARRGSGDRLVFQIHRVPRQGIATRPQQVNLQMRIGPGDTGEPVISILMPGED